MARDAISRLYDVQKNTVVLTCEEGKGGYRLGDITFHAKPGKSIDIAKIHESLMATRLSGGTNMQVRSLEITAVGEVIQQSGKAIFKVAGSEQEFELANTKESQKLRDAVGRGQKRVSVTAQVEGWTGRFPAVLKALGQISGNSVLTVKAFEVK